MSMQVQVQMELLIVAKVVIAAFLGCVVGYERERDNRSAGIRTFGAVCAGAALFTGVVAHYADNNSTARVVANIITGVGFLGAGLIIKNDQTQEANGLTTAANIWAISAVGVAVAFGFYVIAVGSTMLLYLMLSINNFPSYKKWRKKIQGNQSEHKKHKDVETSQLDD